jgi:Flp pilus assembly protein TadG
MRLLRRWLANTRATAAVEFALTVPLLLLLLAGIVEVGRAFQVYTVVNRLATQYATTWADCSDAPSGTCSTEMSNFVATSSIANIVPQLTAASLTLRMLQVSITSGGTISVVYASPSGATLSASETTLVQNTCQPVLAIPQTCSAVVVTASYAHSLVYFQALMTSYLSSHLSPSYSVAQLKS